MNAIADPAGADPPGVSLDALARWLHEASPGLVAGPLQASVIAGGRSNLTYLLTDGTSRWALRRPPLGHVLPTAHDMAREYRVISALGASEVPVPAAVALCTDREVLGEPFYLMSYVDGVVLERPEQAGSTSTAERASRQLVSTLVALHAVDPAAVGLSDFGRPDGFRERQLRRWHQQFLASLGGAAAAPTEHPTAAAAVERSAVPPIAEATVAREADVVASLAERMPISGPTGIVHGDYRLTNVMFTPDLARIAAVVDWEMATLGDPLTDVGLLYVYHRLAAETGAVMPDYAAEYGYRNAEQLVGDYATASGLDVSALDWYIAFGYFKLSVIAAGIHARYRQGLTVGEGFDRFGPLVDLALGSAQDRLGGI